MQCLQADPSSGAGGHGCPLAPAQVSVYKEFLASQGLQEPREESWREAGKQPSYFTAAVMKMEIFKISRGMAWFAAVKTSSLRVMKL